MIAILQALGHEDVFGLKAAIPAGALEMTAANGGSLDPSGNPGVSGDAGVLYVQLPEGHPVITGGTSTDEGIVQNSDTVLSGDTCTLTHRFQSKQSQNPPFLPI